MFAAGEERRCERVPQRVEREAFEPGAFQERLVLAVVEVVVVNRAAFAMIGQMLQRNPASRRSANASVRPMSGS